MYKFYAANVIQRFPYPEMQYTIILTQVPPAIYWWFLEENNWISYNIVGL